MGYREYTGLALDGDILRIARLRDGKKGLELLQLDRISLIEGSGNKIEHEKSGDTYKEPDTDSVFGITEATVNGATQPSQSDNTGTITATDDSDLLAMVDSVDEDSANSNQVLMHNLLESIDTKKVHLGLAISKGATIYEILNNLNYSEIKKKERNEIIRDRLKSIYGDINIEDRYVSEIRDDGAMIVASNEKQPALLDLVDQGRDLYHGSVFIEEILPEEMSVIGMVRANYELGEGEITGIVQMGQNSTRLIFLKGETIWSVSPIIHEGTRSSHLLSTIFSKILYQLDNGKLPSLERLIIADNTLGDHPVQFFRKNFPGIEVDPFQWKPELLEMDERIDANAGAYTSAIATAIAATGKYKTAYSNYSFLPDSVKDRQKVFKLDWHGILLLALIALAPIVFNHFYQNNLNKINDLNGQITRTNKLISDLQPVVDEANKINREYNSDFKKFDLIRDLSHSTHKWSSVLQALNKGMRNINSIWLTSMSSVKEGVMLQGYSLYRNRIPRLADLFGSAVLQNVKINDVRKIRTYSFTIIVQKALKDTSAYSPKVAQKISAFAFPPDTRVTGGENKLYPPGSSGNDLFSSNNTTHAGGPTIQETPLHIELAMTYGLRNTLILLLVFIAMSLGGWAYTHFVQDKEIATLNGNLQSKTRELQQKHAIADTYDNLVKKYDKLKYAMAHFSKSLPGRIDADRVYRYLDHASVGRSYTDINFTYLDTVRNKAGYGVVQTTVDGSGNYRSLYNLIKTIEYSRPIAKVKNVVINPSSKPGEPSDVVYTFDLNSYYAPEAYDTTYGKDIKLKQGSVTNNPFYPLIRPLPPNSGDLLNIESCKLIGVSTERVFLSDASGKIHNLAIGDKVYLGYLDHIDVKKKTAVFHLDKGGIADIVTLKVD